MVERMCSFIISFIILHHLRGFVLAILIIHFLCQLILLEILMVLEMVFGIISIV